MRYKIIKSIKNIFLIGCMIVLMLVTNVSQASTFVRPKIVFGDDYNYPPYAFLDEEGNPTGFNVELAKAVGEVMGFDVEIRLDEWNRTRSALEDGSIDAISGMFFSQEREATYTFTTKHSVANGEIFTHSSIFIRSLEDLGGQTVVVQSGDIVGEFLKNLEFDIEVVEVGSVREALEGIESGKYQYAGVLKIPGLYEIQSRGLKNVKAQNLNLMPKDYCMAVSKENEELVFLLNNGLKVLQATGIYQELYDKWLGVYESPRPMDFLYQYRLYFLFIALLILILILFNMVLQKKVSDRTKALVETNSQLEEYIEESMAMQEALTYQEERSRAILSALPDHVFTVNYKGDVLEAIQTEYCCQSIESIFPQKNADKYLEIIRCAIDTQSLEKWDYEEITENGRAVYEVRVVHTVGDEAICIKRNVTAERSRMERIEYLSYHDQMTGLYNRRFFEEELLRLDVLRNLPLAILAADINGLKLVNDSFGHKTGDELIAITAKILKKVCRSDEIIARIGGDEFAVLIPKMKVEEVEKLSMRILEEFKSAYVGLINVSVSLGWAVKNTEGESIHEVLSRADDHMYQVKTRKTKKVREKMLKSILQTLYDRDEHELNHGKNVSKTLQHMGKFLGFSDEEIEKLRILGEIHDVGKIGIDSSLLFTPRALSESELSEVRKHSEIGYRILNTIPDMTEYANLILHHHEHWDGSGYPNGLKASEIPFYSRLLTIADAYDAMIHERPYQEARDKEEAVKELKRCAGSQFDPDLISEWIKCFCH